MQFFCFEMSVFVQQAMFVYQLDVCIENCFKRPHRKGFSLKLIFSEQKKSWPKTLKLRDSHEFQRIFHGFLGNFAGKVRILPWGPGTEELPDLWFGISGPLEIPRNVPWFAKLLQLCTTDLWVHVMQLTFSHVYNLYIYIYICVCVYIYLHIFYVCT